MTDTRKSTNRSFTAALFAFLVTRVLILVVFLLATNLRFDEPVRELGARIQEPIISLRSEGIVQRFGGLVLNADALWYADIARNGYEREPFDASSQHNWAFFPLYPLILWLAATITGEYGLTGSLLSSAFFLLALVQLYKLILSFGYELQDAERTVFYLAAFPLSYFFSLPVTESLFLLLVVSCLLAAKRDFWWIAGLCGGLAAATRLIGLCLFAVLLVLYWQRYRSIKVGVLTLLLVPAGIVPYMIFLQRLTGNAFAFLDVQAAWGHSFGLFLKPLWDYLKSPLEVSYRWDFRLLNFAAAVLALTCGALLLRRKQWALALLTLLSVIIPLSAMLLRSTARYTMVAFPIFIVLAQAGRSRLVDQAIRAVFLFGLGIMTLLFALRFSLAMS